MNNTILQLVIYNLCKKKKYNLYQASNKMWTYMWNTAAIACKACVLRCNTVGTSCCLNKEITQFD
jgi:hypothetical protein